MICFADHLTTPAIRSMWKECFGDTDEYIDLLFSSIYHEENTLIYVIDNDLVASLQMWRYNIRLYGKIIPFYYLAGLCTLPKYRGQGIMSKLIESSFSVLKERNIPLAILVPAEDGLLDYYKRFGFVQTFDRSDALIDLGLFTKHGPEAFDLFDKQYQSRDFVVLKDRREFGLILKEYEQNPYPRKAGLRAMSYLVDINYFFSLFAVSNPEICVSIKIDSSIYRINQGQVIVGDCGEYDFECDQINFTQLVLGYTKNQSEAISNLYFPDRSPLINLMLE